MTIIVRCADCGACQAFTNFKCRFEDGQFFLYASNETEPKTFQYCHKCKGYHLAIEEVINE